MPCWYGWNEEGRPHYYKHSWALGPQTLSEDCLHLIPVTHSMHGAQSGRRTGACRQSFKFRWEVEHISVSRAPEHSL